MEKGLDLQRTVLAGMLNDENCLFDGLKLSEDDFTLKNFKLIFKAMGELVKEEEEVNIITVYTHLNGKISMADISKIGNGLFIPKTFDKQVRDLRDRTLKRELKKLAQQVQQDEESTGLQLADTLEEAIFDLREEGATGELNPIGDIMIDAFKDLEDVHAGKKDRGLSTGYDAIDRAVGGLRKGEYILLGARPSMGKTALGLNIATNVAKDGKTVAVFSYEMTSQMLAQRLMASEGHTKLFDKDIEWDRVIKAAGIVSNTNLLITDDPRITVPEMLAMLRKVKRQQGLDLVVVDYLQKIPSHVKGDSRIQLEAVSNSLKNMAKLLDVPVVVISSLRRGSEQRENKVPLMSDLKDSGAIEYDADVVMFLHRPAYYENDHYDPDQIEEAELHVSKNRNGGLGIIKLAWKASWVKFFPYSHLEAPM